MTVSRCASAPYVVELRGAGTICAVGMIFAVYIHEVENDRTFRCNSTLQSCGQASLTLETHDREQCIGETPANIMNEAFDRLSGKRSSLERIIRCQTR